MNLPPLSRAESINDDPSSKWRATFAKGRSMRSNPKYSIPVSCRWKKEKTKLKQTFGKENNVSLMDVFFIVYTNCS